MAGSLCAQYVSNTSGISITNNKIIPVQKHKNPCFYKAAGQSKFATLTKDKWQDLGNGDSFSLLPDDLVFRVVCESSQSEKGANRCGLR